MPPSEKFLELIERMKEIHVRKNSDYSGDNDPFYNFDFTSSLVSRFSNPVDQTFVSLIGIKLARLSVLLNSDKTPLNESIEDSFIDIANYCILWGARRTKG